MNHVAAFMSRKQDWTTPRPFFDYWNTRYNFTLDAAAEPHNALCDRYYTTEDDALTQDWEGTVWVNPPYSAGIGKWVGKAYEEARKGATVIMLIPARTETRWWHTYVMQAAEVVLIKGRMRFGGSPINAPFPSCVVIFNPWHRGEPTFSTMDRILDKEAA
jgi:phage N-6-adenine-methyltransferase